ncbi:MAG: pyruvate, phosphate dikinase [Candidatus Diapherotrites archaeon]|nr:pyruvate, phosphate dikinase [Candidatus Diapherotrites archaeon]
MKKYVYLFEENRYSEKNLFLLGNKGVQLAEMSSIGLPVPPGFTITTEACNLFYTNNKKWPAGLESQVFEKLKKVEMKMKRKFGDKKNPLLFSVRSGSYVSMPGMMDTVLNLGLNDETIEGFAKSINSERGAWDSYRRFLNMFGDVVLKVPHEEFEKILSAKKKSKAVKNDTDLNVNDLKELVEEYKELIKKKTGKPFPQNPKEQLIKSINAVFNSWNIPRAVSYRRINKLREDAGTGVNVQTMVFGNLGNDSGTGVSFTRNPSNGKKEHYGEFLLNAQGEDVVAGIRTPKPVDELKKVMPKVYAELLKVYDKLEKHYKDVQDFEFTIERGKLFILQTRAGKRTPAAAVKIAVDLVKEKMISKETALMRVKPEQISAILHKQFDAEEKKKKEILAKGLNASPGAAVGKLVFTAEKAKELHDENPSLELILVRTETSPEDIEGMHVAKGILTARGGMTSHAAVVARGMGKPCVAGCSAIEIDEEKRIMEVKGKKFSENDFISLDGATGEVFEGKLSLVEPKFSADVKTLLSWADKIRTLGIRTNADTPHDSIVAREFGAEGIGLCRTEHMFFEKDRIKAVREMILSDSKEAREKALTKLLPFQRSDFEGIFKAMHNLPVTVRLLDPPLHEFLPKEEKEQEELAKDMNWTLDKVKARVNSLHELNPMLGFRGCRLGVVYPEINEMQVKAIIEAAINLKKKKINAMPEIMIPVLGHVNEMKLMRELVKNTAEKTMKEHKTKINYLIGVMMELPRACLTADEIAEYSDFFSFGTNDLTQTCFGFSRDDAGTFIPAYIEKKILLDDPFASLDQTGTGQLIEISVKKGRKIKPKLKLGICGEHGGDPSSIEFCHKTGLNYVSCSPFRVPVARLAAAQAVLKQKKK